MKNEKLMDETILHYAKMYGWILTQDLYNTPNHKYMLRKIGEHWGGEYCPYCIKSKDSSRFGFVCHLCPLMPVVHGRVQHTGQCCNGLWAQMSISKTWSTFLINMSYVIKYIRENG